MCQEFNININGNQINVTQYGNGARLLIVFHGFGDIASNYEQLGQLLENEYIIVIPDLPYHGNTHWEHGLLTVSVLKELVQLIMKKKKVNRCSIMGYSMGGRLAICLGESVADIVDHFVLVAPEGLRRNYWFNIATSTTMGKWLFKNMTFHPEWVLLLVRRVKEIGLISKSRAAYVERLMKNKAERLCAYHIWLCIRKLRPTVNNRLFRKIGSSAHLFFGLCDELIPPPQKKEIKKWKPATVSVIPTGHKVCFHEQTQREIYNYICDLPKHK